MAPTRPSGTDATRGWHPRREMRPGLDADASLPFPRANPTVAARRHLRWWLPWHPRSASRAGPSPASEAGAVHMTRCVPATAPLFPRHPPPQLAHPLSAPASPRAPTPAHHVPASGHRASQAVLWTWESGGSHTSAAAQRNRHLRQPIASLQHSAPTHRLMTHPSAPHAPPPRPSLSNPALTASHAPCDASSSTPSPSPARATHRRRAASRPTAASASGPDTTAPPSAAMARAVLGSSASSAPPPGHPPLATTRRSTATRGGRACHAG